MGFMTVYSQQPGCSTETALLKIKDYIHTAFDCSEGVLLVLLDISAAYDTLDQTILLSRLKTMVGLSGVALDWFSSYIKDRLQSVIIDNDISSPFELMTGISQGSVLGPLLFLIYMLQIQQIFKKHGIEYHSYADDTQLVVNLSVLSAKLCQLECCFSDRLQEIVIL